MKLQLPLPVNLGNARLHHMVKYRKKKAYWEHLDILVVLKRLPPAPETPYASAALVFDWFVWNKLDPDNLGARKKWIMDWLVTRGYLTDDRESNVTLTDKPQTIDRKCPRVEIDLEEAA